MIMMKIRLGTVVAVTGSRNSLSKVKVCTASTALQILTPPFCGGGSSVVTLQKTDMGPSDLLCNFAHALEVWMKAHRR